jgi:hypothetical protein
MGHDVDRWTHASEDMSRHLRSSATTADALIQAVRADIPRMRYNDADRALAYIVPRITNDDAGAAWYDVAWMFTQAALSMPYATLAKQHPWARGRWVTHPHDRYFRTSFDPDSRSLVFSIALRTMSKTDMQTVGEELVMHASVGWSENGCLGDMSVMVCR